jgi:hypothetical protein
LTPLVLYQKNSVCQEKKHNFFKKKRPFFKIKKVLYQTHNYFIPKRIKQPADAQQNSIVTKQSTRRKRGKPFWAYTPIATAPHKSVGTA